MPSPAPGYSPFDAGGSSIADDSPMGYVPASFSKVRRPPPTETPMSVFDEDDEDAPDWLGEAENALAAEDYQDDGGVYVSSADVEVLKKWADERKELQQRLAAAEHAASTREIEAAELRARLTALEKLLGRSPTRSASRSPSRSPAKARPAKVKEEPPRHSVKAITDITQAYVGAQERDKRTEVDVLREEWRNLRAARQGLKAK